MADDYQLIVTTTKGKIFQLSHLTKQEVLNICDNLPSYVEGKPYNPWPDKLAREVDVTVGPLRARLRDANYKLLEEFVYKDDIIFSGSGCYTSYGPSSSSKSDKERLAYVLIVGDLSFEKPEDYDQQLEEHLIKAYNGIAYEGERFLKLLDTKTPEETAQIMIKSPTWGYSYRYW